MTIFLAVLTAFVLLVGAVRLSIWMNERKVERRNPRVSAGVAGDNWSVPDSHGSAGGGAD